MSDVDNPYEAAYLREKAARMRAESLLEDKARELYLKNVKLEESYKQLQQQQALTMQNEKLATLGTLSAGVAHEINNPLAFVLSNMESLPSYQQAFSRLMLFSTQTIQDESLPKSHRDAIQALLEEEDLEFLTEDLESLIQDTIEGIERVKEIVSNLRSFARTQSTDRVEADLLEGLNSTLKLLNAELKDSVALELALNPLPRIICNPNQINQVFLNLILNAKHATQGRDKPTIHITSEVVDGWITIKIADNGCGMSDEVKKEIFVPFFTTKPIGQGTGMGLAIAYGIIQDHTGEIRVTSDEGVGTEFELRIPVDQSEPSFV